MSDTSKMSPLIRELRELGYDTLLDGIDAFERGEIKLHLDAIGEYIALCGNKKLEEAARKQH